MFDVCVLRGEILALNEYYFYALFFLWKIEHNALAVVSSYISSVQFSVK
jgi:hypothetical protein